MRFVSRFLRFIMSETEASVGGSINGEDVRPESASLLQKCCWVCYGTESDDTLASWVQPCNCKGTSKWVHQACLQRWVNEMQKGSATRSVSCPQCKAEYILVFQPMGPLVGVLDSLEEVTHKLCPFVVGGVMLGSIYWTAITYGAVTVMQVVGHQEGLEMLEGADPLVLMVLLPAVPVLLVCWRALRWEDALLAALRSTCRKLPRLTLFLPFGEIEGDLNTSQSEQAVNGNDPNNLNPQIYGRYASPTRVLCGALILPTISTIVGKILFSSVKNNFHRTILGGLTFVVVKGALNIYHKQKLHVRYSTRKILDYTEDNIQLYVNKSRATSRSTVDHNLIENSGQIVDDSAIFASDQRVV